MLINIPQLKDIKPVNPDWVAYDATVQAYRSNMYSTQSFLLAVAAIVISNKVLVATITIIALLQLWYIWFRLIVIRTRIADYHRFNFSTLFNEDGSRRCSGTNENNKRSLNENTYATNSKIRNKVNIEMGKITNSKKPFTSWRLTRIKIDLLIPISFTVIWVSFVLHTFGIF